MNQIRAVSYLHVFDALETSLAEAARNQAAHDVDARDLVAPLLRLDMFDHNEIFHRFERAFVAVFPTPPRLIDRPKDLDAVLSDAVPLSLVILALHLKLVTQQHYLACVRGSESLDPAFVKVMKEHWTVECGAEPGARLALQSVLTSAPRGRVPAALRDYRRIVFTIDDLLERQSVLDVETLEQARTRLSDADRASLLAAQASAHRNTFINSGIANAAFVYAMRALGPAAPALLAGVVAALSARVR